MGHSSKRASKGVTGFGLREVTWGMFKAAGLCYGLEVGAIL